MDKALQLIDLQKQVLAAKSLEALGFVIANKTHALVRYSQAVFWTGEAERLVLRAASGGGEVDAKGPYTQWMQAVLKAALSAPGKCVQLVGPDQQPADLGKHWAEYAAPHAVFIRLETEEDGPLGGVWLERDTPFHEAELTILNELQSVFSAALALQVLRRKTSFMASLLPSGKYKRYALLALLAASCFPVKLTITAPAEIVAQNAGLVSAPFDGVIESITLSPGANVAAGDVLAVMERQGLESKMRAAEQALSVAQTALARLRREALLAPEKKTELEKLKAEIDLKTIEYDFARDMLQRAEIKAPQAGVAIFADPGSLIGKPIATGEAIMQVADPARAVLLIRVPVEAMLAVDNTAPVRFSMNVSPLSGHRAVIESIGYQASADADGLLTYKVRAALPEGYAPRIGWKGSAKIYGDWSILAYAVLRRPLISLRNITGL